MSEILRQSAGALGEFEILTLDALGAVDDVEENGTTFEENALIKARVGAALGYVSVADDSGLEVDALGGEPGVYSARYSGEHGDDEANNRLVLEKLSGVPTEKRTARFVAAIACVFPNGHSFTVRGTVEGRILESPRGNNGFGYDPIFIPEGFSESFAQMTSEMKNSISHRYRATEELSNYFKKQYD